MAPAPHSPQPQRTTVRTVTIPSLPLECGVTLHEPTMAYHQYGEFDGWRGNVVVVLHALTGSSDVEQWWPGLVGPGAAIDTDHFAVVAPNLLGSCYGTTGARADAEPFPPITTRDQARAIGVLLQKLRIPGAVAVMGGSLGGMVALEFAASFPGFARQAVVFAAPAQQSAWGLACNALQLRLLDALGDDGLELARAAAMLTYRTPEGLERRFGARAEATGEYEVASWLRAHGERFRARFDRASYRTLLGAMDAHDLGREHGARRGWGGAVERIRASRTDITGVGIKGDQLYAASLVEQWVRAVGGRYAEIDSVHGHDGFLLELEQVAALLKFELTPGFGAEVA